MATKKEPPDKYCVIKTSLKNIIKPTVDYNSLLSAVERGDDVTVHTSQFLNLFQIKQAHLKKEILEKKKVLEKELLEKNKLEETVLEENPELLKINKSLELTNLLEINEDVVSMAISALKKESAGPKPKGENKVLLDKFIDFYNMEYKWITNNAKLDCINLSHINGSLIMQN